MSLGNNGQADAGDVLSLRTEGDNVEITPEIAWIGLHELASWCELDARLSEVSPEAMISAYSAMERAKSHPPSGLVDRASPRASHENAE
jgi:hypothetical protein